MERRIREEDVTKFLLKFLELKGWNIVCFDFPQSGTGVVIHPNDRKSKNKGAFIPDIVAHKDKVVLIFENKDRFVYDDFLKVEYLRTTSDFSNDLNSLLSHYEFDSILYGIAIPETDSAYKYAIENISMVDFVFLVNSDGIIQLQEKKILL